MPDHKTLKDKTKYLEKILWEYETSFSITLSELYRLLSLLMFDSYSFENSMKIFRKIPEPYKANFNDYLVETFENNVPAGEFVFIGATEEEEQKKDLIIGNIRNFLSRYQNLKDART